MLLTGPFWVLDLWDSLPPPVQAELVEALAARASFRDALVASGLLDDNVDDLDDELDDQLGEWLNSLGLVREIVENFARRRQAIQGLTREDGGRRSGGEDSTNARGVAAANPSQGRSEEERGKL